MGNIIATNVEVKNTVKTGEKEDKELFDKILKKSQQLYQENKEQFLDPEFCERLAISYSKKLYQLPIEKIKTIHDKIENGQNKKVESNKTFELIISYDPLKEEKFLVNELSGRLVDHFSGKKLTGSKEYSGITLTFPDISYIQNRVLGLLDNMQKREFKKKEMAGGNKLFLDGGQSFFDEEENEENNFNEENNEEEEIEEEINYRNRGRDRNYNRGRDSNRGRDRDGNRGRDRDGNRGRDRNGNRGRDRDRPQRNNANDNFVSVFAEEKNEKVNYNKFKEFKEELEAIKSEKPKSEYKPANFIKKKAENENTQPIMASFNSEKKPEEVKKPEESRKPFKEERPSNGKPFVELKTAPTEKKNYDLTKFIEEKSTFVPKKEREPIKEILQKKLSEYEERKMKNMISSSDKYCLDEKFPCKLSKKEMCEKIIYHFVVRNNLISAIASVVPVPNSQGDYSGSFTYDRLKSLNEGFFCVPPYYSDIQDTDDNIRIQKILKYLNILDEKECTSSGGYLLRLTENQFKELMSDAKFGKKYFDFIKKINNTYQQSLKVLYEILEKLETSVSLSTENLNELSRMAKYTIDELYIKTQFNYLLAVLVILDFNFVKNKQQIETKQKRIEKILKEDFTYQ